MSVTPVLYPSVRLCNPQSILNLYQASTLSHVVSDAVPTNCASNIVSAVSTTTMSNDDSNPTTNASANITDYLAPVTPDKEPITFVDNDATIEGILYEIGRFFKRNGLFQLLLKHRAVSLSNGKLAVEAINTVWFTTGKVSDDKHSFDDPCPPSATRFANAVATAARSGTAAPTDLTGKNVPKGLEYSVILAPHMVESEDARLLKSLNYTFGSAESVETLIDDAEGSGLKFLELLRARAAQATAIDRSLSMASHARIIRDGVPGELDLVSFKQFLKEYKKAKLHLRPTSRQVADAEVEMINLIANKCEKTREIYNLRLEAAKPTSLDTASAILLGILRARVRSEQIDEVTSGAKPLALASERVPLQPAAPNRSPGSAPIDATALAAALSGALQGNVPAELKKSLSTALAATLKAVADPRKLGAGTDDTEKPTIPRGADGKPNKWVQGMSLCNCGVNGGKHLFKDCPKKKEAEKAKKAKELAAAAEVVKAAGNETAAVAAGSAEAELSRQLAALLASISPAHVAPANGSPAVGDLLGDLLSGPCGNASADGE